MRFVPVERRNKHAREVRKKQPESEKLLGKASRVDIDSRSEARKRENQAKTWAPARRYHRRRQLRRMWSTMTFPNRKKIFGQTLLLLSVRRRLPRLLGPAADVVSPSIFRIMLTPKIQGTRSPLAINAVGCCEFRVDTMADGFNG